MPIYPDSVHGPTAPMLACRPLYVLGTYYPGQTPRDRQTVPFFPDHSTLPSVSSTPATYFFF